MMNKFSYPNVKVLIPLQLASTRIKLKNIRPFYKDKSLFDIKAKQLLKLDINPSKIYISSEDNDERVVENLCQNYGFNFLKRPPQLTGNAIKQGELIGFILNQIPKDNDDILWVQVTNPLFNEFRAMLDSWQDIQNKGFDSIVAVKTIRHHLLTQGGIPLNFNFGNWHKVSQDLPKIYEILWSAFLLKRAVIEENQYHIGIKPYFMAFDKITTIDIDEEMDFKLASKYYEFVSDGGGGLANFEKGFFVLFLKNSPLFSNLFNFVNSLEFENFSSLFSLLCGKGNLSSQSKALTISPQSSKQKIQGKFSHIKATNLQLKNDKFTQKEFPLFPLNSCLLSSHLKAA